MAHSSTSRFLSVCSMGIALFMLSCGDAKGNPDREYFSYAKHGDKPALGIWLKIHEGQIVGGRFYILTPEYPANMEGVSYPLKDIKVVDGATAFRVSVLNGAKVQEEAGISKVVSMDNDALEVDTWPLDKKDGAPNRTKLLRLKGPMPKTARPHDMDGETWEKIKKLSE